MRPSKPRIFTIWLFTESLLTPGTLGKKHHGKLLFIFRRSGGWDMAANTGSMALSCPTHWSWWLPAHLCKPHICQHTSHYCQSGEGSSLLLFSLVQVALSCWQTLSETGCLFPGFLLNTGVSIKGRGHTSPGLWDDYQRARDMELGMTPRLGWLWWMVLPPWRGRRAEEKILDRKGGTAGG